MLIAMSHIRPHDLPRHVAQTLHDAGVPAGAPLVAAVSGGSDSIALLAALAQHPDLQSTVSVGHVDHGLRPESQREEAFVHQLCRSWSLPFHSTRLTLEPGAPGNLADRLRTARYDYLLALVPPGGFLLTAHHADDQAVTLLMRLIEGAALPGLAGIPLRRQNIVRPLLDIPRRELRSFLRAQGIGWCEDSSNEKQNSYRNRVRTNIWSRCVEEAPLAPIHLSAVAQRLREDNDAVQAWANQLLASARGGVHWVEVELPTAAVPPAVLRRILQTVLTRKWHTRPLSSVQWAELQSQLYSGRRLNLPGRVTVHNKKNVLVFEHESEPETYRFEAARPGDYTVPTGRLRLGAAEFPVIVRSWRAGDRMTTGEKVPHWLARHGVPRYRRTGWPVITQPGDERCAAQGDGIIAIAVPSTSPMSAQAQHVFEDGLVERFQG